MGMLLIGIAIAVLTVVLFKDKPFHNVKYDCIRSVGITIAIIFIIMSFLLGEIGEPVLVETERMSGARVNTSTYIFVDEDNEVYYICGDYVEVNSTKSIVHEVIIGNYEEPIIEKYKAEKKMTFWGLPIFDATSYKIYIPNDMAIS